MRGIKNKAQVILETAIVLVCLALLGIASTQLFSNLNLNMVQRLNLYRDSRLKAVNNPAALSGIMVPTTSPLDKRPLSSPATFLDYFPQSRITLPSEPAGPDAKWSFFEDPRLNQATLLLEKQSLIQDLVMPYKINQANYLANQLQAVWGWCSCLSCEDGYVNCIVGWSPAIYVDYVRGLVNEAISLGEQSYIDFGNVIVLYQETLDKPLVPGPYDPNVLEHPQEYIQDYNPDLEQHQSQINEILAQNMQNREQIQNTIDSLTNAKPGLRTLLNYIIYGDGIGYFLGLNFVSTNIGAVDSGWWGGENWYNGSYRHRQAVNTLGQAVDYTGAVYPVILDFALAIDVNEVYNLLQKQKVSKEDAKQAWDLVKKLFANPNVKSPLKDTLKELNQTLKDLLKYWKEQEDQDYYLDLAKLEAWALKEVAEISIIDHALKNDINKIHGLLNNQVTKQKITTAYSLAKELLKNSQVLASQTLKQKIETLIETLDSLLTNWNNYDKRQEYLELSQGQIQELNAMGVVLG